jgi:Ca2+-binding RTX toxin-like protein
LPNDFAVKVIKAVGNYGEIYERHFNSDVLRRDSNALATDFGLQYALPVAGLSAQNKNASIGASDAANQLQGNTEANIIYGLAGNDTIMGYENNDLINGNSGEDFLAGHEGNDTLDGGQGDDTVQGGKDNDVISGSLGNDVLVGELGDDTLTGGPGEDVLKGGEGRDTFVLIPGSGTDTIADFTIGQDGLRFASSLTFEQLTIIQGTGAQAQDTLIRLASSGEVLASLTGVSASSLDPAMFV